MSLTPLFYPKRTPEKRWVSIPPAGVISPAVGLGLHARRILSICSLRLSGLAHEESLEKQVPSYTSKQCTEEGWLKGLVLNKHFNEKTKTNFFSPKEEC